MLPVGSSEAASSSSSSSSSEKDSSSSQQQAWRLVKIRSASWFISLVVNLAALTVSFQTSSSPPAAHRLSPHYGALLGGCRRPYRPERAHAKTRPSQDSMFFGLIVPFLPNLLKDRVGLENDAESQSPPFPCVPTLMKRPTDWRVSPYSPSLELGPRRRIRRRRLHWLS